MKPFNRPRRRDQMTLQEELMQQFYVWWLNTQAFQNSPIGSGPALHEKCACCHLDRVALPYPIANLEAMATYLATRENPNDPLVLNQARLQDVVYQKLLQLPHTYRTEECEGEPDDIIAAKPLQLVRSHMLLNALSNPTLIREMGQLVERNPKDGQTELGGLVTVRREGIHFAEIPSPSKKAQIYQISGRDISTFPHLAVFHLHALYDDCTRFAGPSYREPWNNRREESDLGEAGREAEVTGESHNVVVTKLTGHRFNVDYYAAQMGMFYPGYTIVDLGVYEY